MLIDILKIIGLIILCIIGLILLIILLFFLIPVRYKGYVSYNKLLYAELQLKWFVSLITLSITFDGDTDLELNFFGIKRSLTDRIEELKSHKDVSDDSRSENTDGTDETEAVSGSHSRSLKYRSLLDQIKKIIKIVSDPLNREMYVKVTECLQDSIRAMMPKQVSGYFIFGFDDPADTGQLLTLLAFFYPLYGEHVNVYPYFEKKEAELRIDFYGDVSQILAGFPLVKILLDKDVRRVYNQMMNKDNSEQ